MQDSYNLNKNGIGLGLAISDKIVSHFGGNISFKSDPMIGSTFVFKFQISKILDENYKENKDMYIENEIDINENENVSFNEFNFD